MASNAMLNVETKVPSNETVHTIGATTGATPVVQSTTQGDRPKRNINPPKRFIDENWDPAKERAKGAFHRRKTTIARLINTANELLKSKGSRAKLRQLIVGIESTQRELENTCEKYSLFLDREELLQNLEYMEIVNDGINYCLEGIESQLMEREAEPETPAVSISSRPTHTSSGRSSNTTRSNDSIKRARVAELKLAHAIEEAEKRRVEERERISEEIRRREQERQLQERRRIRELEYESERLRLEAQIDVIEERKDPETLMNRLRDFEGIPPRDLHVGTTNESTPVQRAHATFSCNATQASKPETNDPEERLNVSWVQKFCDNRQTPEHVSTDNKTKASIFPRSLPRLELPSFKGDPLEWPAFISLFKCLVHDQPLTDTQRMTHLQRALDGNAKKAVGGMLSHGHLYKTALVELEEQFGNEEVVVRAYLKTVYDHPKIAEDNFTQLRSFYNTLHVAVSTLKSLDYDSDLAATDNLRRAVDRLPETLKGRWGEKRVKMLPSKPNLRDLDEWLRARVRAKALVSDQTTNTVSSKSTPRQTVGRRPNNYRGQNTDVARAGISTFATNVNASSKTKEASFSCPICGQAHTIERCEKLKGMNVDQRAQAAKEKNLCFCCLSSSEHISRWCNRKKRCGLDNCEKRHHPLIHGAKPVFVGSATVECCSTNVLLQIVPLLIRTPHNHTVKTYALLDSGSQATLILESLADQIGLNGQLETLNLGTINSDVAKQSKRVSFSVSAVTEDASAPQFQVDEAWTVSQLNLPPQKISKSMMKSWAHLEGLDMPEVNSSEVTVLLGANVIDAILHREVRRGNQGQPAAVLTAFGWTLTGSVKGLVPGECLSVMCTQRIPSAEDQLHQLMQHWWRTDSFGTKYQQESPRSIEDQLAVKILEDTVKHVGDRYEAGLLWKDPSVHFPDNRVMAERRLISTERALRRDHTLAEKYKDIIEGYVAKGYARKLSPEETAVRSSKQWLLPHHPVSNPNKPGKVRIVMDAKAKQSGVSLNHQLLVGPDLLNNLSGVLLRFREERVAVAADIESMFHQCKVIEEDQPALRFLWRDLQYDRPPDVYQMQRMIFGAASSPCTANYVLKKTAEDNCNDPSFSADTIDTVRKNFYVDDLLKSVRDEDTAIRLQRELTDLLARGGFKLTKWSSSSREVLCKIPQQEMASPSIDLDLDELPVERSLGLKWNTDTDCFRFSVSPRRSAVTKRGVLSQLSSVFDPLGVLAPFLLPAKCLIQTLWRKKIDWDQPLDDEDRVLWENWVLDLSTLEDFELPRCLCSDAPQESEIQLHVFGDASEIGFGAVCYVRYKFPDGKIHVSFVMAKTRVAPLRQLSIPRLELQAALLAVRLSDTVKRELTINVSETFFWSDSMTVLLYIANESRRFHTFVANRVSEIQESSSAAQWRFVPGRLNPADDCTRGMRASEMTSDSRWISGPAFLQEEESHWPRKEFKRDVDVTDEDKEVKKISWCGATKTHLTVLPDPSKYSSWTRYRRVIAWVYRFTQNARKTKDNRVVTPLSVKELQFAETVAIKKSQLESFALDLDALSKKETLPPRSRLPALNPYIDQHGILRVGGRLRRAPIQEENRHPIILDPKHDVSRLIISHQHLRSHGAGDLHVLSELRQRYWILQGLRAVSKVSNTCGPCRRRKARPCQPRMADLPLPRLGYQLPPFTHTGVDYFGPLYVRNGRKTEKRYGALFTCMTTRAIHLEVAYSLETDTYIMAMQRMMARRGRPAHMYSDNGTNFVGAEKELREALQRWNKEYITDKLSQDGVQWHFNPPASPHFGGAWERLVKSVKRALKAIAGNQRVTDETLLTFMTEAEALINSRPLTPVSSDCQDLNALTPNHFLLGRANVSLPPDVLTDADLCSRKRWRHAQMMANHFWDRWVREYLPTLTERRKWRKDTQNLSEGDLVLVAEDLSPRGHWPLARVTRVLPGDDGMVRAVEVRTKRGSYVRPATKICQLERVSES